MMVEGGEECWWEVALESGGNASRQWCRVGAGLQAESGGKCQWTVAESAGGKSGQTSKDGPSGQIGR